jgi:hypothetical protein
LARVSYGIAYRRKPERKAMAFNKFLLPEEAKAQYQRVADLLGPVGEPALLELCEMVWHDGSDSAYWDSAS